MDRNELFLETLAELQRRIAPGGGEYDVLMAAGLLRKLLLDESPLMDQVNRQKKLRIRFRANCGGPSRVIIEDRPVFWSQQDGFDPETGLVRRGGPTKLTKDQMLRCVVLLTRGHEITVHELIDAVAHVEGAVHAGKPHGPKEEALAAVAQEIRVGGLPPATRALLAIARVTLRGLEPLRSAVRQE